MKDTLSILRWTLCALALSSLAAGCDEDPPGTTTEDQGPPLCASASECTPPASACVLATCTAGTCGTEFAAEGTACTDSGGNECDGSGACIRTRCGDGATNGDEACDPSDPATPCCAANCLAAAAEGLVCGTDPDAVECDAAPQCDGLGFAAANCVAAVDPDDTPCADDGLFCTGAETCQSGVCTSAGTPCVNDLSDCADACNEAADTCDALEASGARCARSCHEGSTCDGAGACTGGSLTCG